MRAAGAGRSPALRGAGMNRHRRAALRASPRIRLRDCVKNHHPGKDRGLAVCSLGTGPIVAAAGISSQVRPSRRRPVLFLFIPPHCLKKNGTPRSRHWLRMSNTQVLSIGRAPGPDSPPTMTQSIDWSGSRFNGPSRGSRERNLTRAAVFRRSLILET